MIDHIDHIERTKAIMKARFSALERVVAGLPEAQRRLAEIQVSQTSGDGLVTATVDLRGRLTRLRIDPRIYRNPDADALAEAIVRLAEEAADRAGAAGEAVLRDLLPHSGDLAFSDAQLATMLGRDGTSADRAGKRRTEP